MLCAENISQTWWESFSFHAAQTRELEVERAGQTSRLFAPKMNPYWQWLGPNKNVSS